MSDDNDNGGMMPDNNLLERRNLIKKMRDRTDLPFLTCKNFLIKSNWNFEEAIRAAMNKTNIECPWKFL